MPPPYLGKCLCGQVVIEINSTHPDQIVCHCSDCRQTSGSAFSTNVLATKKDLKITGPIKVFNVTALSGNTVGRVFCSECGSAISHRSPAFGDCEAVQTGNFADFAKVPIKTELFVKDRWEVLEPFKDAKQVQIL